MSCLLPVGPLLTCPEFRTEGGSRPSLHGSRSLTPNPGKRLPSFLPRSPCQRWGCCGGTWDWNLAPVLGPATARGWPCAALASLLGQHGGFLQYDRAGLSCVLWPLKKAQLVFVFTTADRLVGHPLSACRRSGQHDRPALTTWRLRLRQAPSELGGLPAHSRDLCSHLAHVCWASPSRLAHLVEALPFQPSVFLTCPRPDAIKISEKIDLVALRRQGGN